MASTMSRYVKRTAETTQLQVRPPGYLNPNNRVFNPEQEGKLQAYLKRAAAIYFGLSLKEVSVKKTGNTKLNFILHSHQ